MSKKTLKTIGIVIVIIGLIGAGIVYYLFNLPQRDVQASKTDYELTSTAIVNEYLQDSDKANGKYLSDEGESKILAVTGKVSSITEDLNNQKVILLKDDNADAGVSATFTQETNSSTDGIGVGQTITVKGVIRSGAGYDEDLELYEDVIMEKCDIVKE